MNLNNAIKHMKDWARGGTTSEHLCCLSYLDAIPKAIDLAHTFQATSIKALRVQLLYAIGNTHYWRGEIARKAKKSVRDWIAKEEGKEKRALAQEDGNEPSRNRTRDQNPGQPLHQ